jgi:hypothetical protein
MSAGNAVRLAAPAGVEALMELTAEFTVALLVIRRTSLHVLGSMLALPCRFRRLPGNATLNRPAAAYPVEEILRIPARESRRGTAML